MSEGRQHDETDAAGEREETIRDLDVPEDDAGRLRGGQQFSFSKIDLAGAREEDVAGSDREWST